MVCWKVGTEDLIASLLLLELESESVDSDCCGILVEEEKVLIAEMVKLLAEELVVAVGDAEEREVEGVGFKEGDD